MEAEKTPSDERGRPLQLQIVLITPMIPRPRTPPNFFLESSYELKTVYDIGIIIVESSQVEPSVRIMLNQADDHIKFTPASWEALFTQNVYL